MSDTVEFILKMKDLVSSPLRNIGVTGNAAFKTVDRSVSNSQKALSGYSNRVKEINKQLDGLTKERKININARELNTPHQTGGLNLMGMGRGMMAAAGITGVMGGVAALGKLTAMGMEAEAQAASFEVLAGQKGRGLFKDLTAFAQDSIFGNEVYKNAQTMLAFGQAADDIMPRMKMLGDISMGNTQRFEALTLAFSQMQATGRLMGQDLLQFINAGFNPLQELSVMTGKSMAVLKKEMEKGAISADMVTRAFQHATSEGGKFYNMTNKIADTAYGKWEAMKGQIQGIGRDMGTALLPWASALIDVADGLLHVTGISKTLPETLAAQQLEINALVKSITGLNEGNALRGQLMETLKQNAPDLFSNLDIERTKNADLLDILRKINGEYTSRINLASQSLIGETAGKEANELMQLAVKARAQAEYNKTHYSITSRTKFVTQLDRFKMLGYGVRWGSRPSEAMAAADKLMDMAGGKQNTANAYTAAAKANELINSAKDLLASPAKQKAMWGKDVTANAAKLSTELQNWRKMYDENNGKFKGSFLNYNYSTLESLVRGGGNFTNPKGVSNLEGIAESDSKIHGGGPKVITINFNAPVVKDTVIHAGSTDEGLTDLDDKMAEGLVRALGNVVSK